MVLLLVCKPINPAISGLHRMHGAHSVGAAANSYPLTSVESQGRTLEQMDWVYEQPNPVKASLQADHVVVQKDGRVTEKLVTVPGS